MKAFHVRSQIQSYLRSDGLDNDSDGLTDFPSDLGCTSADDDDETG